MFSKNTLICFLLCVRCQNLLNSDFLITAEQAGRVRVRWEQQSFILLEKVFLQQISAFVSLRFIVANNLLTGEMKKRGTQKNRELSGF
jgi:hypothetical protein